LVAASGRVRRIARHVKIRNARSKESPVKHRENRSFFALGRKVGLSEFLLRDYRPFYETWKDPVTRRNFNSKHECESYDDFLATFTNPQRLPQRFHAAVIRLTDYEAIGRISLAPESFDPDLGIWIYEAFRFAGYGTEAVSLAVEYIFENLGLSYIVAGIYQHNRASVSLFTKLGFRRCPELDEIEDDAFGDGKILQLGFRLDRPMKR
jgi:RimJ/RimL family protein N-acetyltransferase